MKLMTVLDRYIIKTVISATALVLLIFLSLEVFVLFVNELGDIGSGHYYLGEAFKYVLMRTPHEIYQLFPMAALLGCLLGLGWLANNSELVVMRCSGMSLMQISRAVIGAGIIMLLVMFSLGEGLGPWLLHQAEMNKTTEMSSGQTLQTAHGIWVTDGKNFLHINTSLPKKRLEGITLYEINKDHQLIQASYAEYANFEKDHWVFYNIAESDIAKESVTTKHVESSRWPVKLDPHWLGLSEAPNEMSLIKLVGYLHFKHHAGQRNDDYALAFWQRLYQPLATLLMLFLGIPFVFGPLRSVSMGMRLLAGILVGFGFFTLNQFFGPFSLVYQVPPGIGTLIPILICSGLAFAFVRTIR